MARIQKLDPVVVQMKWIQVEAGGAEGVNVESVKFHGPNWAFAEKCSRFNSTE